MLHHRRRLYIDAKVQAALLILCSTLLALLILSIGRPWVGKLFLGLALLQVLWQGSSAFYWSWLAEPGSVGRRYWAVAWLLIVGVSGAVVGVEWGTEASVPSWVMILCIAASLLLCWSLAYVAYSNEVYRDVRVYELKMLEREGMSSGDILDA